MLKRIGIVLVILLVLAGVGLWFLTRPGPPMEISPQVRLTTGTATGGWTDETQTVAVYNGLPFAAPPTGTLRWAAPQDPESWSDVRDARDFGNECLQYRDGIERFVSDIVRRHGLGGLKTWIAGRYVALQPSADESEDCLYLNVRSGNVGKGDLQPVMVWFHGGSHMTGAGSDFLYQSDTLVKKGVVLVTINYRLGPFGYLAHPELSKADPRGVSGNYGLLDQIKSLEWVKDNITAFGGDPNNVTIFGESAGSQSVTEVMASPLGDGLYHKAILQSGASTYNRIHLDQAIETTPSAEAIGQAFLAPLLPDDAVTMGAAELRNLPAEDIVNHIPDAPDAAGYFLPNVDGVVVPRMIGDVIRDGSALNVPILAGYNADEGTLFYDPALAKPTVLHRPAFPEDHADRVRLLEDIYGASDAARLINLYGMGSNSTWDAGAVDMLGDDVFGLHMRYLGKANARAGLPTWLYFFSRTPASPRQSLGAFHASELAFVFDSHNTFLEPTEADFALTEIMGTYWTNFAKTANPNSADVPEWPAYTVENDAWLKLDHSIETITGLRHNKLDIMERVLEEKLDTSLDISGALTDETVSAALVDEQVGADSLQP